MPGPRDDVIVYVDHAGNHSLEEPLGKDFLVRIGKIGFQPGGIELAKFLEVAADEDDLARDEFPVDL